MNPNLPKPMTGPPPPPPRKVGGKKFTYEMLPGNAKGVHMGINMLGARVSGLKKLLKNLFYDESLIFVGLQYSDKEKIIKEQIKTLTEKAKSMGDAVKDLKPAGNIKANSKEGIIYKFWYSIYRYQFAVDDFIKSIFLEDPGEGDIAEDEFV